MDLRRRRPRGGGTRRSSSSWIRSASAPAISTPVGPPPTTTKFSAPWSISAGSRSASSNTPMMRERSRCASSRQYSGNACSSAPGVRKKFGCEPAASTSASPEMLAPSVVVTRVRRRVHRRRPRASLTSTLVVVVEQLAQRVGDVAGGQLRGRHLVEQRLELVVVVAVDQRDADVVVPGQPPGAPDAREAAADDDDVQLALGAVIRHARRSAVSSGTPMRSQQVVADAQRVGHRGQRRVHRADAREEARVDDVEVVDLVGAAVGVRAPTAPDRCRSGRSRPGGRSRPPGCRS